MPKILHILDHSIPIHSGYSFRTRAILKHQRRLGWETAHITSTKHPHAKGLKEDVEGFEFYRTLNNNRPLVVRVPALKQIAVIQSLGMRLEEVITREHPDILHAHSPALNGIAALHVGWKRKLPVVYECRAFWEDAAVDHGTSSEGGIRYRLTRGLETTVFRRAAAVTTICEGLREDIIARGIPRDKVTVIPNAVDIEYFADARYPDSALIDAFGLRGKIVLGFIGSFYAYEGLALLLRALPAILANVPNVRLLLVGGGPQETELKALAQELGLASRVIFTGRVSHGNIGQYYDLIDLFIYPRLSIRLTELVTPLKPLEALAKGKLVVASDVGGHRELIQNGKTGVLFDANNRISLTEAVLNLLDRRSDWPEMRSAARNFAKQERSWSSSVERYGPIYNGLLGALADPPQACISLSERGSQ